MAQTETAVKKIDRLESMHTVVLLNRCDTQGVAHAYQLNRQTLTDHIHTHTHTHTHTRARARTHTDR